MPLLEILLLCLSLNLHPPPRPILYPEHPACSMASLRLEVLPPWDRWKRRKVCDLIAHEALARGLDVSLAVELSWHESNWEFGVRNRTTGCAGPLQVAPYYWCPGRKAEGCDLVDAGFRAWGTYLRMARGREGEALCRYLSGDCSPLAQGMSRMLMGRVRTLRHQLRGSEVLAQR